MTAKRDADLGMQIRGHDDRETLESALGMIMTVQGLVKHYRVPYDPNYQIVQNDRYDPPLNSI